MRVVVELWAYVCIGAFIWLFSLSVSFDVCDGCLFGLRYDRVRVSFMLITRIINDTRLVVIYRCSLDVDQYHWYYSIFNSMRCDAIRSPYIIYIYFTCLFACTTISYSIDSEHSFSDCIFLCEQLKQIDLFHCDKLSNREI